MGAHPNRLALPDMAASARMYGGATRLAALLLAAAGGVPAVLSSSAAVDDTSACPSRAAGRIAQLRMHNDSSPGYFFPVGSPPWCADAQCGAEMQGLHVVDVTNSVELPLPARTLAVLALTPPRDGFSMQWEELSESQRTAAQQLGGEPCNWPLTADTPSASAALWPAWEDLSAEQRAAAETLGAGSLSWPPHDYWRDMNQVFGFLRVNGAVAVGIYHGTRQCHESHHLVHIFGRCISSPYDLATSAIPVNASISADPPAVVTLGSRPALA